MQGLLSIVDDDVDSGSQGFVISRIAWQRDSNGLEYCWQLADDDADCPA